MLTSSVAAKRNFAEVRVLCVLMAVLLFAPTSYAALNGLPISGPASGNAHAKSTGQLNKLLPRRPTPAQESIIKDFPGTSFGNSSHAHSTLSNSGNNAISGAYQTLSLENSTLLQGNNGNLPLIVQPYSIVYDNQSGNIYIGDGGGSYIYVIRNGTIVEGINTGLKGIASETFDYSNGWIYASSNSQTGGVAIINGTKVVAILNITNSTFGGPSEMAYDPVNQIVYVADYHIMYEVKGLQIVGDFPTNISIGLYMTFDPSDGYIYADGLLHVYVISNNSVISSISGFEIAGQIAYDPASGDLYVANYYSEQYIFVINGLSIVGYIPLANPNDSNTFSLGMAYDSANGYIYASNEANSTVLRIKGLSITAAYSGSGFMGRLIFDSLDASVYAIDDASPSYLIIIGANGVVRDVPLSILARGIAYNPENNMLYVSDAVNNTVILISNNTVKGYLPVFGQSPDDVLYDSAYGYVYVSDTGSSEVTVLNGMGVVKVIPVGAEPTAMTLSSNGSVFVADSGDGQITMISGLEAVTNITAGTPQSLPYSISFNDASDKLYAAVDNYWTLSIFGNNSLYENVSLPSIAWDLLYDPLNNLTYASLPRLYEIAVIYDGVIVSFIHLSDYALNLTFNPRNGLIYALEPHGVVQEVSGLNLTGQIAVGSNPSAAAYDSSNGLVYVLNTNSQSISIVQSKPYKMNLVQFNESGLPQGSFWNVSVFGLKESAYGSSVAFGLPNGTYDYRISTIYPGKGFGYIPSAFSGNFTVAGSNTYLDVVFIRENFTNVTFFESGLPSGSNWWINTSYGQSYSSNSSKLVLAEPRGNLSFVAQGPSRTWMSVSGSLNVTAAPSRLYIFFRLFVTNVTIHIYTPPYTPLGSLPIPNGTVFYLNLTGGPSLQFTLGESFVGTTHLYAVNGTYSYTLSASGYKFYYQFFGFQYAENDSGNISYYTGPGGNRLPVTGPTGLMYADLAIQPLFYAVTFLMKGLPPNTNWSIDLHSPLYQTFFPALGNYSDSYRTNGTSITVYQFPGNYSYSAAANYHYQNISGRYTLDKPIMLDDEFSSEFIIFVQTVPGYTFDLNFSEVVFNLTVAESGIPPGMTWSFMLNGTVYSTDQAYENFSLPYGNYTYTPRNLSAYYATIGSGVVSIEGNRFLSIHYLKYAHLVLFSTQNATVFVDGRYVPTNQGYVDIKLAAGNYTVEFVTAEGDFYRNLSLSPGQTAVVTNPAQPAKAVSPAAYLPVWLADLLAALIVGEAAVIALIAVRKRGKP